MVRRVSFERKRFGNDFKISFFYLTDLQLNLICFVVE